MHHLLSINPNLHTETPAQITQKLSAIPVDTTSLTLKIHSFTEILEEHPNELALLFSSIPATVKDLSLNATFNNEIVQFKSVVSSQSLLNVCSGKAPIFDNQIGKTLASFFSSLPKGISTIRFIGSDIHSFSIDSLAAMRGCFPSVTHVFLIGMDVNFMSKQQLDSFKEIFPRALSFTCQQPKKVDRRDDMKAWHGAAYDGEDTSLTSEKIRYLQGIPRRGVGNTIVMLALLMKQRKFPFDVLEHISGFIDGHQNLSVHAGQVMLRDANGLNSLTDLNRTDAFCTMPCCASWLMCALPAIMHVMAPAIPMPPATLIGGSVYGACVGHYMFFKDLGKFTWSERKAIEDERNNIQSSTYPTSQKKDS